MRMRFRGSAVFTFALFGFLATILYLTLPLNPVARMVPLVVAIAALALVSLQILLEVAPGLAKRYRFLEQKDVFGIERFRERDKPDSDSEVQAKLGGRELEIFAWMASIPVLIYIAGFLTAVPLFLVLYLKRRSGESWLLSITVAAASLALLYFLFIELLRTPLYEGRLWMWLLR